MNKNSINISEETIIKGENVYQKVSRLREAIEGFSKDTSGYQYKYVSGNQVLKMIKNNMDTLHLLLIPELDHSTLSMEQHIGTKLDKYKKEAPKYTYLLSFAMNYVWVDADNPIDRIVVPWMAVGEQDEDIAKAFGTALTYTERYFLLKFFNLPTDVDDPDFRQVEPTMGSLKRIQPVEVEKEVEATRKSVPEKKEVLPEFKTIAKLNKKQTIQALDEFLKGKDKVKSALLAKMGKGSLEECSVTHLKSVAKQLKITGLKV